MRIVHEAAGDRAASVDETAGPTDSALVDDASGGASQILATNVEVAESSTEHARGLRFRRSLPDDFAYVMHVGDATVLTFLDGPSWNIVDMLFMRVPLDVVWLRDERVVKVKRMRPWRSFGMAEADTIVELPAGTADAVSVGDTVRLETN